MGISAGLGRDGTFADVARRAKVRLSILRSQSRLWKGPAWLFLRTCVARAAQDNPSELEVWDQLSVLANKTNRTQQFVEAIAQAVPENGETALPGHVEIDLAERAATLYDEMLGEIDRATPYRDRILAREPGNERAFMRLKQILTTREPWLDVETLYERKIGATADANRRADLLNEVVIIAEEITGDVIKGIYYYECILEFGLASHDG